MVKCSFSCAAILCMECRAAGNNTLQGATCPMNAAVLDAGSPVPVKSTCATNAERILAVAAPKAAHFTGGMARFAIAICWKKKRTACWLAKKIQSHAGIVSNARGDNCTSERPVTCQPCSCRRQENSDSGDWARLMNAVGMGQKYG